MGQVRYSQQLWRTSVEPSDSGRNRCSAKDFPVVPHADSCTAASNVCGLRACHYVIVRRDRSKKTRPREPHHARKPPRKIENDRGRRRLRILSVGGRLELILIKADIHFCHYNFISNRRSLGAVFAASWHGEVRSSAHRCCAKEDLAMKSDHSAPLKRCPGNSFIYRKDSTGPPDRRFNLAHLGSASGLPPQSRCLRRRRRPMKR